MTRRQKIGFILTLWSVLGIGVLILFIFLARSSSADLNLPFSPGDNENAATSTPASPAITVEGPSRLIIPKLNINANVQHVGITKSGSMGTPTGIYKWQDVAWYKLGPKPGEVGNATISGHLDNAISLKAVFYNLGQLQEGDEVLVKDANGTELRFRVVKKAYYNYKEAPANEIFGATNKRMLNLITCAGTWIQAERSYTQRLVIYTELIQ